MCCGASALDKSLSMRGLSESRSNDVLRPDCRRFVSGAQRVSVRAAATMCCGRARSHQTCLVDVSVRAAATMCCGLMHAAWAGALPRLSESRSNDVLRREEFRLRVEPRDVSVRAAATMCCG